MCLITGDTFGRLPWDIQSYCGTWNPLSCLRFCLFPSHQFGRLDWPGAHTRLLLFLTAGPQLLPLGLTSDRKTMRLSPLHPQPWVTAPARGSCSPWPSVLSCYEAHLDARPLPRPRLQPDRLSCAVINSVALDGKGENLRASFTLSSSAVRDTGIPELCMRWTTTNGITQSMACPWQEKSQARKIKQVQKA